VKVRNVVLASLSIAFVVLLGLAGAKSAQKKQSSSNFLGSAETNSQLLVEQGRQVFRFDAFGDEAFWGGQLRMHEVVNKLTPRQALTLGLKVDAQRFHHRWCKPSVMARSTWTHPAVTRLLVKSNAVLGRGGVLQRWHNTQLRRFYLCPLPFDG
jgi:hypothetical protein